ncbi:hypothetical protein [Streptomyces sp. NRRL WC-3618]|uniref:hypothetical protein n=1 Tax=Streptomyces sp. NRRL WC-3618 TaxID=1519490 RepID=UPI0006AE5BAF|nr:hypothetical protein [Streptomyces sp. NRRL WC-3618]
MSGGSIRRRIALGLAVLTASGMFSLASSGTAEAAAVCSGRKARTLAFATGEVDVYRSNGYLCAMTVPKRQGGHQWMSVSVRARGGRPVVDGGNYTKRAGPVTVHTGRRQVWIKGTVGRESVSSGWIRL